MKVDILASGSNGNVNVIQSDDTCILIDVGEVKTKIEKLLLGVNIVPYDIDAVFVTHGHKDHACGVTFANKYKIPVYASEGSWKEKKFMAKVEDNLIHVIDKESKVSIKDLTILSFHTHHDDYEPLGYTVSDGSNKASICLDTGHVDSEMLEAMKGSQFYIIESNHDPVILQNSDYPNATKKRIASPYVGHLSNIQTAEALGQLVQGEGEKIYLTHLSSNNNMPSLALMTTVRQLMKKGFKQDKHYQIEVF